MSSSHAKIADFAAMAPWTGIIGRPKVEDAIAQLKAAQGKTDSNVTAILGEMGGLDKRLYSTRSLADEDLAAKIKSERLTRSLANDDLTQHLDAEILARTQSDDGITATVAQEVLARQEADGTVLASLATEIAARQGKDNEIEVQVDEERAARIEADGTIMGSLTQEVTARNNAISAAILTEQTARIGADGDIQAQVLTLQEAIDALGNSGSIAEERQARIDADGTINVRINQEVAARQQGDQAASAQVDEERQARIGADGTIQASLDQEITARGNQGSNLQAQISQEAVARVNADGSLGAEYVLSVITNASGYRRATGYRITNLGGAGGATEFIIQSDRFGFCDQNGYNNHMPFRVEGGTTFADELEVSGKFRAGSIATAADCYNVNLPNVRMPLFSTLSYGSDDLYWNIGSLSGAPQACIDVYPWSWDSNPGYYTNRFGKDTIIWNVNFRVYFSLGQSNAASAEIMYRINDGSWGGSYGYTHAANPSSRTSSFAAIPLSQGANKITFGLRFLGLAGNPGLVNFNMGVSWANL